MLTRPGTSLVELLLALTLAALVLATATVSLRHQQVTAAALSTGAAAGAQQRPATALLDELALLAPTSGDILPGSSDSAVFFRATIATGVACDDNAATVTLSGEAPGAIPLGAAIGPVHAGDTLWWYRPALGWLPREVYGARTARSACSGSGGPASQRLQVAPGDTIPSRAPLRVTRAQRLVFYRGSDGRLMLGLREWSATAWAMGAPQPVAGPFDSATTAGERTRFRYFAADDGELAPEQDSAALSRLRRVRMTLWSGGIVPLRGGESVEAGDSIDVALSPR